MSRRTADHRCERRRLPYALTCIQENATRATACSKGLAVIVRFQTNLVQVTVLEARDIPRMDKMGTSDPHVELFSDPKRREKTKTKKNTLTPKWDNEVHYLMVQVCYCLPDAEASSACLCTGFQLHLLVQVDPMSCTSLAHLHACA
jgi:hypothetical protein